MEKNLSEQEQVMAQAQLAGRDVRIAKRLVFWPTLLFGGDLNPALRILGIGGTGYLMREEDGYNKVAGSIADQIYTANSGHEFANDVRRARIARHASRVLGAGLLVASVVLVATGVGAPASLATFAASHALLVGSLGALEGGWVGAKTVENVSNGRANKAARRILGR